MKIVILGDTHGRSTWKLIRQIEEGFDQFVFIGDYFDSWEISGDEQAKNFNEIIAFKSELPDRVVMLYGNHEHHYMSEYEEYSGKQHTKTLYYRNLIGDAIRANQIQMCYQVNKDIICTHAGISKTWCEDYGIDPYSPEEQINEMFRSRPHVFNFFRGDRSGSGSNLHQSPIWIRPETLVKDMVDEYTQIVGHTTRNRINLAADPICIDTLGTSGEYLIIEDNEIKIRCIN